MTENELITFFKTHERSNYLNDEDILPCRKLSNRPDLNAFLLLDKLVPSTMDIISCAEHDVFFLEPSLEDLAAIATTEDLLDLIRCGVMLSDCGGLEMYA